MVDAPAALEWDIGLVSADVHKALRLRESMDYDTGRVDVAAEQATKMLDVEIDACESYEVTGGSALHRAAVALAVLLMVEPWLEDPVARVRAGLPKERWGIG